MLLLLSICSSLGLFLLPVICTTKSGIASLRTTQSRSRMMVSLFLHLYLWGRGYIGPRGSYGKIQGLYMLELIPRIHDGM